MTGGLEIRGLEGDNTRSVAGAGCESCAGVRCTGFVNGDYFDGGTFWVGCGWFFFGTLVGGGTGPGKFADSYFKTIGNGVPESRCPGQTRVC